ncbi:cystathionine beta-lyase [Bacillus sp. 7504-2]|nr:cystathionine beta-lyase [Bacillus sp. 7504-2]
MGIYDFHKKIDRLNTASVKWGMNRVVFGTEEVLPMWVADMDFEPPLEVTEVLKNRIDHGIYGYTYVPDSVSQTIQAWVKKRHDWEIDHSAILYSPGVVPSIGMAIQALTNHGDKVMLQSPVYTPFFNMIEKNERIVVNSPLKWKYNRYEIDFADFEEKLKEGVKLFLLCNPHNPSGRAWNRDELTRIAELCIQYNCYILSDEIHSDLMFKPNRHLPIASLDERYKEQIITCIAPSKTFNLAGLQASAAIIPNKEIRSLFKDVQNKLGFFSLNTFGIIAMEAAYKYGDVWLEELLVYLQKNVATATSFIENELPNLTVMQPDGTYLLWIDCRKLGLSDEELKERLIKKGKLGLEPGPKYGHGGEGFVRMNIACTHDTLVEGLKRLKTAFT